MSYSVQVTDQVTPMLNKVGDAIRSTELSNAIGRGVTNVVKAHLDGLQATRPNKQGWPRQNFWAKASRSTSWTAQPGIATITVSHLGYLQRLKGGEIKAKNVKFLTIPATGEAYGKRAREFSNLKFGYAFNDKISHFMPALIKKSATRTRTGRVSPKFGNVGIGSVMYWLTPSVVQKPDPTVAPTDEQIVEGAKKGADLYFKSRPDIA